MPTKKKITGRGATSVAAATIGNCIWGFSFVFTKAALNACGDKYIVLANRFVLAAVVMLLIMLAEHQKISFKGKHWGWLLGLVATSSLYFFFETWAIQETNSTFTGVTLSVVPVFSIGTGWLFLKERPGWLQSVLCLVPIAGVVLITVSGKEQGAVSFIGVVMALLTCVFSALYKTCNRFLSAEFSASERNFADLTVKAVIFPLVALSTNQFSFKTVFQPLTNMDFLVPVLFMVLLSSIVANILVSYAAGYMSVMRLSVIGAVSTLSSAFGGILFQGDPCDFITLFGAAIVIVGIFFVTKYGKNEKLRIKAKA